MPRLIEKKFKEFIIELTNYSKIRAQLNTKSVTINDSNYEKNDILKYTGDLYSQCWVNYNQKEFDITVDFFEKDLEIITLT